MLSEACFATSSRYVRVKDLRYERVQILSNYYTICSSGWRRRVAAQPGCARGSTAASMAARPIGTQLASTFWIERLMIFVLTNRPGLAALGSRTGDSRETR